MVCYDTGAWQAFLDGEVTGDPKAGMEKHLLSCGACRERLEQLRENQIFTDAGLAGYIRALNRSGVDTGAAWARFSARQPAVQSGARPRKGVLAMLLRYRMAATAAVMVLALAVTFSFGSVRTAASELLTIFRVENVKTVNISPEDMSRINKALGDGAGAVDMENFGRIEFKGNGAPGEITLEEARSAVDFRLKLPDQLPDGYHLQEIRRNAGGTMNFTLDTVNTNRILQSLGSEKLLPEELNGRTFTMELPAQITARYAGPDSRPVFVGQGRSPELKAPIEDAGVIRDALLGLPFLPDDLRSQLAAINDWQHTFVVPNVGGTSREVEVAGARGVFITSPAGEEAKGKQAPNCLIWQKAGVVYIIGGPLTLEQALAMAASMK